MEFVTDQVQKRNLYRVLYSLYYPFRATENETDSSTVTPSNFRHRNVYRNGPITATFMSTVVAVRYTGIFSRQSNRHRRRDPRCTVN